MLPSIFTSPWCWAHSIKWKDEQQFITHPWHAFQPSVALKPVPLPDEKDSITHFWVEQVDGQGFAEVDAVHIHEFKTCGFVGWHHKLCKRLVFFYMPGSLDSATEARVAEVLKPLKYTGESKPMDIGIDLGDIPCDSPTMETQMPGVHSMEWLEQGGRVLVSERMMEYIGAGGLEPGSGHQEGQGGNATDLEEGEIGGFDHDPSSRSDHDQMPSSSGFIGPVCTGKTSARAVQKINPKRTRKHGKQKEWAQQDVPSDRRQHLWSHWIKFANFFNDHQDLLNDLEPLPATVPGKHSNLKKPDWGGMQRVADDLCSWIQRNCETAQWLVWQHSGDRDHKHLWERALRRLDYKEVWNTPQMDMPCEDETAARKEWLQAMACWLPELPWTPIRLPDCLLPAVLLWCTAGYWTSIFLWLSASLHW